MLGPSITLEHAVHTAHVEVIAARERTDRGVLANNFNRQG
jgi:hypothetical protein